MCSRSLPALFFFCITAAAVDRAAAQTASLSLSGGAGFPGSNVTLNISLTVNSTLPAAVQWDLLYSTVDLNPEAGTFYASGAAATVAGKQATCATLVPGDIRCIVAGLNDNTIGNGILAAVTLQIASTTDTSTQVTLSNLAASTGGSVAQAMPITGAGATVTINQPPMGGPQATVMQNGVRSLANSAMPNPPGSLVYAQGTNMATVTSKPLIANLTPLPTHLVDSHDSVSVAVNGVAAPMYYALPNYVAFQLPWQTNLSTGSATMVITRNGVASAPLQFPVGKFSPGFFTTSGSGAGLAWAIYALPSRTNPSGDMAQPANTVPGQVGVPATAGDLLYVYAAGLGPVGPKTVLNGYAPCPIDAPCTDYNALDYSTTTKPAVTVGGVPAPVTFAGLHPVYPGIYLVFFKVPSGAPKGNAVPVWLQIGTLSTDPNNVTIAVQ